MMLPILISVSVAPVSYFFCASAPLLDAASTASAAAEAIAILFMIAGIAVSLFFQWHGRCVMAFLIESSLNRCLEYHFTGTLTTKSPPRDARRAASLIVRRPSSDD